jgi:hypothetical protein
MSDSEVTLIDFLKSVCHNKKDLMTEENESIYVPFLMNRFLSAHIDTVLYANEMNQYPFLSNRMQYDYLRYSIRAKSRYCQWLKKEKVEKVDLIREYFNYNYRRAEEVAKIISDEQLESIKKLMSQGGRIVDGS